MGYRADGFAWSWVEGGGDDKEADWGWRAGTSVGEVSLFERGG